MSLPLPAQVDRPWLVMIAGPYLSGTDGDAARIAANRAALEAQALPVYARGHLPLIGEWLACPIIEAAGGCTPGDAVFEAYQYPVAERLLMRCDAVLRLPGASRGADLDVARARARGLPVVHAVEDLPEVLGASLAVPTPGVSANAMPEPAPVSAPVRVFEERVLSDDWYLLKKTTFERQRRDGSWQRQSRETYDRGNGAVLLLYHRGRGSVVLTRQFRFPAYVNGCTDGMLVEACAGLLDGDDPLSCIRREAEEETGYRVRAPRKVFEAFMSPGSVTEKLHFFVAEFEDTDRRTPGGGCREEGEDIEVIELPLHQAMVWARQGRIQDAKTLLLLEHAARVGLSGLSA